MADPTLATIAAAATVTELLVWEDTHGKAELFADLDRLHGTALAAILRGEDVIAIQIDPAGRRGKDRVESHLAAQWADLLDQHYGLERQQRRGAWYIPDDLAIKPTSTTLPALLTTHPRHALTLAHDASLHSDSAATTAAAVWLWCSLEPTTALLLRPLSLWAGERAPLRSVEEAQSAWETTLGDLQRLGLGLDALAQPFAPRRWTSTTRAEQVSARQGYLAGLRNIDPLELARRVRALRLQTLLGAVLKKTKGKPQAPLARTALSKAVQPVLSAYFSGYWPTLLGYADLTAHPDEEIVTALPTTELLVGVDDTTVHGIAREQDLAAEDVEAILAAYLGTRPRGRSPIEERLEALTTWWGCFDNLHAAQQPGQPALWGLVDEGFSLVAVHTPYQVTPRLYRDLLPGEVAAEIDRLWDGVTLPRWPENIVSEPHPHRLMAEALGPAVRFWHGIALTAWYETEGPYGRTTLDQLTEYYRAEIAALEESGLPVDRDLFEELRIVQHSFGPPEEVGGTTGTVELGNGRSVEVRTGGWQRRDGFERAREIITRHRRAWAGQHLGSYLESRWRQELSQAVRSYHKHLAARGKAPTFKQFARMASLAANHWFGGDLSGIYRAMGESAPHTPRRVDYLPVDAYKFALAVYVGLGGEFIDNADRLIGARSADYPRLWALARLAMKSIYYVQLCEAIGKAPEARRVVDDDVWGHIWPGGLDEGWPIFTQCVDELRSAPPENVPDIATLTAAATPQHDPAEPGPRDQWPFQAPGILQPRQSTEPASPGHNDPARA